MEIVHKSYPAFSPKAAKSINTQALKNYLIQLIPLIFHRIAKNNKIKKQEVSSVFDLIKTLNVEFSDYVLRVFKSTKIEVGTALYALCLIDKLANTKKIFLSYKNMHKVFFTAFYISIKLNEDKIFNENLYSFSSGMSSNELAFLEKTFIDYLEYDVNIKDEEYSQYLEQCIESNS